jgi:osmotically-inducible protein OsmY
MPFRCSYPVSIIRFSDGAVLTASREKVMSDDKRLKQAVLDELEWEPSVNAAHIGVTAKDGVVTLLGHVENFLEKSAAEKVARRVHDVKAVAEEIEVRLPFNVKRGDEEIASAVVNRLNWDSTVPSGAVKARVEKGWVTLTGDVDWHFQQEAAENDVRGLWGVIGLSNEMTIRPKPNASNIRDKIMMALGRSRIDPASINVFANYGKVKLTGNVNSWHEYNEAASAAWAAPGTTSVENEISVG